MSLSQALALRNPAQRYDVLELRAQVKRDRWDDAERDVPREGRGGDENEARILRERASRMEQKCQEDGI
jgi:hypothetical protein